MKMKNQMLPGMLMPVPPPSDQELDKAFDAWWREEVKKFPVEKNDIEEHAKRIARIAWHNGAYQASYVG